MDPIYSLNKFDAEILKKCFENYSQNLININECKALNIYNKEFIDWNGHDMLKMYNDKMRINGCDRKDCWIDTPFVFFEDFVFSFLPPTFKLILLEEPPLESIFRCTELLMKYHDCRICNNCEIHISLMIKFYLIIDKYIYSLPPKNHELTQVEKNQTFQILDKYLSLIQDIGASHDLILLCLKLFLVEYGLLEYFLKHYEETKFKAMLISLQNMGCVFWKMFPKFMIDQLKEITHKLLNFPGILRFKLLVYFGLNNSFSPKFYNVYFTKIQEIWEIKFEMSATEDILSEIIFEIPVQIYFGDMKLSAPHDYSKLRYLLCVNMRVYQVIYLYHNKRNKQDLLVRFYSEEFDRVLQLMWATIPDAYLIKNQFLQSCGPLTPKKEEFLTNVWNWYNELVSMSDEEIISPRSLKHLSRIAIRNHLSSIFQLPRGVSFLNLPDGLRSYLLLEEYFYKYEKNADNFLNSIL